MTYINCLRAYTLSRTHDTLTHLSNITPMTPHFTHLHTLYTCASTHALMCGTTHKTIHICISIHPKLKSTHPISPISLLHRSHRSIYPSNHPLNHSPYSILNRLHDPLTHPCIHTCIHQPIHLFIHPCIY